MSYTLPASYTTVSRIGSAFPAINSVSTLSSGVVHQFIGDVEAEINSKLAKQWSLPLTVDCPVLTAIATRESIYRIAVQRGLVQFPPAQQGRHPMQQQHIDDQKLLDKIAGGVINLVDSSGNNIAASTGQMLVYSTTEDYVPTFSEGAWVDQIQDKDKLDDDLSNRGLT